MVGLLIPGVVLLDFPSLAAVRGALAVSVSSCCLSRRGAEGVEENSIMEEGAGLCSQKDSSSKQTQGTLQL